MNTNQLIFYLYTSTMRDTSNALDCLATNAREAKRGLDYVAFGVLVYSRRVSDDPIYNASIMYGLARMF